MPCKHVQICLISSHPAGEEAQLKQVANAILGVAFFASSFAPVPVRADETVLEAQRLLNSLGFNAGPADGSAGKRTTSAVAAFLSGMNFTFDGTIDQQEVELLRRAAADYQMVLRYPGKVLAGRDMVCKGLSTGRFRAEPGWSSRFPPIASFDDSQSIGASIKKDAAVAFSQSLLVNAAAGAGGDEGAATAAGELLVEWARAKAGLETAVDRRYLGAGNAGNYDPTAAAPALDMENAAFLGGTALMALEMLGNHISASEHEAVLNWALELVDTYDFSDALVKGEVSGLFMSSYPRLLGAIHAGDAELYKKIVEASFVQIREKIDANGAILKNANRGDRAIHYQSIGILFALSVLEVVESQGSKIPVDIEAAVHRAVSFFLDADRDNNVILPYSKMGFNNPGVGTRPLRSYRSNSEHYWWMISYISNYPDTENAARLRAFISRNDTYDRVVANIMPAVWAAYPINCFVDFDMSPKRVEEAIAFVDARYPKVAALPVGGLKMGKPKVKGATEITYESSWIRRIAQTNLEQFSVFIKGLKVDGARAGVGGFEVYADFAGPTDDLGNLTLLRIVGLKVLVDGDGFDSCGNVAADRSTFRLHIGEHSESNSCVLGHMDASSRKIWASLLDGLEKIVNDGDTDSDPSRARLKQIFDYVVY